MIVKKRTVCDPNCSANPKCGLIATIDKGKITEISSGEYSVANYKNRICMMGTTRL